MQTVKRSRRAGRMASVVVLTACTLLYAHQLRQIDQMRVAANGPYGRYTARQILGATAPICQKLLPFSDGLQLVAEPHAIYADNGTVRRLWEVDCVDDRRQEVGYFWWDAETGTLNRFKLSSSEVGAGSSAMVARSEAVGRARQWMAALGWGSGAQWQVCQAPRLAAGAWIILLGNKFQRIRTQIDAKSGLMVSAMREATN